MLGFAFAGGVAAVGGESWRRRRKHRATTMLPALANWRMAVLSPDIPSSEGTVLDGRFEVDRILARGGFATVFLSRDRLAQNRPCAVKIFRHELVEKSWMGRRFQQEVLALTQVQHPNVVRIYGYGNAPNGAPYLAMEFVDGKTLRDLLKEGQFDRQRAAAIFAKRAARWARSTRERLSSLLPDASLDLPLRIREFLTQSPFGLSPASIDLIAAALEFDPSRRRKNANEFAGRIAYDLGQ